MQIALSSISAGTLGSTTSTEWWAGRQPLNFGVGIASEEYKHTRNAKVIMLTSESHHWKKA